MAINLTHTAEELRLLRTPSTTTRHRQEHDDKFKYDRAGIRPHHIDDIVEAIYDDLTALSNAISNPALNDLSDVTLTAPAVNDVITYNGTGWVNQTPSALLPVVELDPVISAQTTPPGGPTSGDRYLITATATGAWLGKETQIAEWDGAVWQYTIPVEDNLVYVTNTLVTYRFNGTSWVQWEGTALLNHGNQIGNDITYGTTDAFDVIGIRDSVERLRLSSTGVKINNNYTLPITDGTIGQFIKTDGTGNLSWDTVDLSAYLTTASAASTYVPLTRELTINGVTYDLSANRSWTISTSAETLAQTLAAGNTSGAYDILMNTTQVIGFKDGDNTYTTSLSNNQSQAANRTVYLPTFDGTLTYKTTSLTSNYILKGTTNEAVVSSSLIYDNGTAVAIGSTAPVSTAALKIKGRLIVSTQEVTANDNYNVMLEVGVGNGVLFSDGTSGATGNNQLGYIFGDGGLQIRGRNNASAEKFNFSAKSSANRFEFYSDDAATHLKMTSAGVINYTHTVANDGFNILSPNTGTTTNTVYSSLSVVNADTTADRLGIIGFTAVANTARHAFIGARYIDANNGDLIFGTKSGASESIGATLYSGNNFGIGTSSSATARLHVKGATSDSSAYALKVDNSSSSALLYVRNEGNILAGSKTPSSVATVTNLLDLGGQYSSSHGNSAGLKLVVYNNTDTQKVGMGVSYVGSGNVEYYNQIPDNGIFEYSWYMGTKRIISYDGNASNTYSGQFIVARNSSSATNGVSFIANLYNSSSAQVSYAGVSGIIDSNTAGSHTGSLVFYTATSGALSEKARIDSSGNLSVGVSSATARTHIKGSTADSTAYALKVENSATDPLIYVRNDKKFLFNTSTVSSKVFTFGGDFIFDNGATTQNSFLVSDDEVRLWFGKTTSNFNQGILANHSSNPKGLTFTVNEGGSTGYFTMYLTQDRNVGIGFNGAYTDITARTHIKGSTADNTAYALKVDNSSSAQLLYVRNDGINGFNDLDNNSTVYIKSVSTYALRVRGNNATTTGYWAYFENSTPSPMMMGRNDGLVAFNSNAFTNGNYFFNAVNNTSNTISVQRSEASAGVGTYAVIGVVNTNSSANNYTRAFAFSDNYSYDMATIHAERIDANRGAWHLYTRNGGGSLVNHLSTYVDGSGNSTVRFGDATLIELGTTTGNKIGSSTSQKLGFWNATPIVQPTTGVAAATFVANTSAIADDTATFDGYTIGQVVKALRNTGLLA